MTIKLLSRITNSKIINKHINKVINDDTFAAKALVLCAVSKDVFAYAVRYKTTLENKKIPEKRRPFVAAMDLASGFVTAILQIAVGFSIANPKLQNAIWKKMFSKASFKDLGIAKKSFASILTLLASGIITERILVPLIATPLAEKIEKKYLSHDKRATAPQQVSHKKQHHVKTISMQEFLNHLHTN